MFFAAMMLGLASCQTEPEGLDVIVGGEAESFVTVSITETTRATSADSGLANVDGATYDLRYILEVYDKENDVFVYRDIQTVETNVKSVSFPVRLIPERDYNFVVWADFVTNGSEADLYYNTLNNGENGLNAVTIADGKWLAMDEARDAYTAVALVEDYNSGKSINLDLIRPFGKLRVVTTDIEALKELAYDALPTDVRVEYKTKVYSGFNALKETANTAVANATFAYNLAAVYDYTDANATSLTLFTDYIFGTETGTIQFDMTVTYENGNVATNSFNTEIPVKRNYLTTITGDILTDGNNIKVDVSDDFENEENPNNPPYYQETISSAADFFAAVDNGGEYIIISDITISSVPGTLATTRATASKSTTIDLNGYTITVENKNNTGAALITLTDGQTIVFEGEGEITLTDDSTAAFIDATDGCVVVEGGDVEEDVVYGNCFEIENNADSFALLEYICNNGGTFTFTQNLAGNVTVKQRGHNIVIDGNGFNFDGTIVVDGENEYPSNYTLVIKNVNFETDRAEMDFISGLSGHNEYPHNITIENCSFNNTAASQKVVGIRFSQFYNLRVINCTGTNLHSLLQAQSCDNNVLIDGVRITDSKGGISFGNTANATIKNSTIDVEGYGVRSDGDQRPVVSLTVENCDIDAYIPVCVRKLTSSTSHYNLTFVGDNALTAGGLYQATLSYNEYEDGVSPILPVSTYTLTGAEGMLVYPRDVVVTDAANLIEALKNNDGSKTIYLKNDIIVTEKWDRRYTGATTSKPITIDGMGNTLKFNCEVSDGYNHHSAFRFEAPAVVQNLTIDMSETTAPGNWLRAISSHNELVVDNCTFIGSGNYSKANAVVFGDKSGSPQWNYTTTITNSIFTNWSRGISDNENANELKSLYISGNTFTNAHAYMSAHESITFVDNVMTNSQVNITSYSNAANATVVATGNTLDNSQYNIIGAAGKKFDANNVDCQEGFTVNTL